jgi:hypothetical protein
MPRRLHAIRDVAWQIVSVAVRTRAAPWRVEQAYRILIADGATTHQQVIQPEGDSDACGDLRQGVHRATGASADDRQSDRSPPRLGVGERP